jgi:hypothetical protein
MEYQHVINGRDTWAPPYSIFSATAGTNITYTTTYQPCFTDQRDPVYSNFSYIDTTQTFHPFGLTIDADGCFPRTVSGTAADNSGYYLTLHSALASYPTGDVWDLSGIHVLESTGTYAVTDTNGNSISVSYSSGTTTYTDPRPDCSDGNKGFGKH